MAVLLAVAVALAFADSSIVVLALPELYGEFDTSIVGVSWVITAYNVAITVAALAVLLTARRVRPVVLLGAGLAVFAAASLVCGLVNSLPLLLGARAVQGVGAAGLLAGALAALAALAGDRSRGVSTWLLAATVGAAVGPALGGVLTELLSWRAVFLVQAPAAVLALISCSRPAVRRAPPDAPGASLRGTLTANGGFVLVFAALVGALFLAVLLVVVVWGFTPALGALVVSALPAGALAARFVRCPPVLGAVGGATLLAGGLIGLAFLPDASGRWAAPALAACGIGLGLIGAVLGPASLPHGAPAVTAGTATVAARHFGFVLGLVIVAPLLAADLESATREATRAGVASILDARIPVTTKIPLALDLRDAIEGTPRGHVPDLAQPFAENGADDDPALRATQTQLQSALAEPLTRGFRPSFVVSAILGALAVVPALLVARRTGDAVARTPTGTQTGVVAVGVAMAAIAAFVAVEIGQGARDFGEREYVAPCTAGPVQYPGDGLDPALQRIVLSGLNGAACELGAGREELVLSLVPRAGFDDVQWDQDTLEQALEAGFLRSIDDGEDRGSLNSIVATVLRGIVRVAPIDWLLDRVDLPFD
ncbi:MAG TPA: MFS transporter [Acidimicrobiales bacterium]|jgi:predicted MFS family arabinose efflux permease|nr:MFS transporter [Acidimicrobiales bacterium]